MKKIAFILVLMTLTGTSLLQAQAWEKSSKVLSIHIGGASYFYPYKYYDGIVSYRNFSALTGQLLLQGEFGVHEYVGVGFSAGFGGGTGAGRWGWRGLYTVYPGYNPQINIPVGVLANFHFYQLIADKTGANLHADKLDVYAGVSVGSGVAFINPGRSGDFISPLVYGGPHVGVRYFFTEKLAVTGEVGYGKTFVNAGLAFNL